MIAFSIGSIDIYWYGIMYMLSFVIGYATLVIGQQRGWYRLYPLVDNLLKHRIDELVLAIMIGVMVGGRLGHVVIYDLAYFIQYPLKIFALQQGGMSFIGGIIATIVSVFISCYTSGVLRDKGQKTSNLQSVTSNTLSLLDAFIPLVPVGIFFGRFGNFLNQELYGILVPVDGRGWPLWIIQWCQEMNIFYIYDKIGPGLRINTNLLSMVGEGLLLVIVLWVCFFHYRVDRKRSAGQLSAVFLGGYSCVRFVLEYLRQDSQGEIIGWLSKSQWIFVGFMIIALGVWIVQSRRIRE